MALIRSHTLLDRERQLADIANRLRQARESIGTTQRELLSNPTGRIMRRSQPGFCAGNVEALGCCKYQFPRTRTAFTDDSTDENAGSHIPRGFPSLPLQKSREKLWA
jgi:hypothetical protein